MRSIAVVSTPAGNFNLTTLVKVKQELKITDTNSDDLLTDWIEQASGVAARYCNRTLVKETITETFRHDASSFHHTGFRHPHGHEGGIPREGLTLNRYPIIEVASVTVDGKVLDPSQYEFDETMLYRLSSSGTPLHWNFGVSTVVVYDAGYEVPIVAKYADLERAVIEMVREFRSFTLREDPTLKSRETVGVSKLEWWIPGPADKMLPAQISGLLDQFVKKWGWMS